MPPLPPSSALVGGSCTSLSIVGAVFCGEEKLGCRERLRVLDVGESTRGNATTGAGGKAEPDGNCVGGTLLRGTLLRGTLLRGTLLRGLDGSVWLERRAERWFATSRRFELVLLRLAFSLAPTRAGVGVARCGLLVMTHELLKSPLAFGVGAALVADVAFAFAFAFAEVALGDAFALVASLVAPTAFEVLDTALVASAGTGARLGEPSTIVVVVATGATRGTAALCAHNIHSSPVPATAIKGKLRVQKLG